MDQRDVVATLSKLAAMDRDAVRVYGDAMRKIGDQQARQQLDQFQQDHRRHVEDIEGLLRQRNWQAVGATGEFEALMAGFQKQVELAEPDDGVMVAMDLGERATNAEYAEALQMDLDAESRRVVMRNLEDERQHLRFIESLAPAMAVAGAAGAHGDTDRQGPRLVPGGGGEQGGQGEPGGGGMRGPGTPVGGDAWEPGPEKRGETAPPRHERAMGNADSSDHSVPRGGLNADVRKGVTSRGSEMVGGGTGADERHPNMAGQVEGDSGSSGSSGAGSGGSD